MNFDCIACDLSRDGKALATFSKAADGAYGVSVSDPFGSPTARLHPGPVCQQGSLRCATDWLLARRQIHPALALRRRRQRRDLAAALPCGQRSSTPRPRAADHPARHADLLLDAGQPAHRRLARHRRAFSQTSLDGRHRIRPAYAPDHRQRGRALPGRLARRQESHLQPELGQSGCRFGLARRWRSANADQHRPSGEHGRLGRKPGEAGVGHQPERPDVYLDSPARRQRTPPAHRVGLPAGDP